MHFFPWLILFSPLVAALLILLVTRGNRYVSAYLSVAAVTAAFVCSCGLLLATQQTDANLPSHPWVDHLHFAWINFAPYLQIDFGLTIDGLSRPMLFIVTFVGLLVHVYSLGYMHEDRDMARYYGGLSLFMFSMLGIVMADNFIMMFIFWELVGVSSFLLIGHWYERPQAANAANKAFLVNRIGDFGFMLGILMLWRFTGSVNFHEIETTLGMARDLSTNGLSSSLPYLTVTTLLIFCGPMGKSAQVPLHVWLPDAMEGPTPVSALIHAATMVAAGVYLLVRITFLLALVPMACEVIAWIGIITAVFAALIAIQQSDIKRILAYSTLSQLGYMICAVGCSAGSAAMFHLFTHAFFKALLFLGAGAVIHAMHHEQNIWKMGGLRTKMPVTFWTFLIGTLALMGCPLFSGFFSKDEIISAMAQQSTAICLLGLFTAFLTAFYMTRLFIVVFLNQTKSAAVAHAHEVPAVMSWPLAILAVPSVFAGYSFVAGPMLHGVETGDPLHSGAGLLGAMVPYLAIGAFLLGLIGGFLVYRGRMTDPLHISVLRRKFYVDEFYAALVRNTQDALASASAWFDRWIIDGLGVRGLSGATWGSGFVLRFLQVGNLQAYAIFFGIGVVVLVYLAIAS